MRIALVAAFATVLVAAAEARDQTRPKVILVLDAYGHRTQGDCQDIQPLKVFQSC